LWIGLLAPSGTPRPVIDRLSAAISQALALSDMKSALAAQGFEPLIGTPEQFDTFYRSEVEKWAKVIQAVGLTAE
jgi:tripartite-type tricarboxylate transporter receptor subunit TctC